MKLTLVKPEPEWDGDLEAPADKPVGGKDISYPCIRVHHQRCYCDSWSHSCACAFCRAVTVSSSWSECLSPSPPSGSFDPDLTWSGSKTQDDVKVLIIKYCLVYKTLVKSKSRSSLFKYKPPLLVKSVWVKFKSRDLEPSLSPVCQLMIKSNYKIGKTAGL